MGMEGSRDGHGGEEGEGEGVGKVVSWGAADGGSGFILKAQTQKGVLNPQGLSRIGFTKRKY